MTTAPSASDVLAEIREWAATLPTRSPTILRVGAGVTRELNGGKPVTRPLIEPPLPIGVDIIEDAGYPPGQWRLFDQWDEEISAGVIPVPGATMRIVFDDGTSKDMRVMTVSRNEAGRITEYTAADAALVDGMPYATSWFHQ